MLCDAVSRRCQRLRYPATGEGVTARRVAREHGFEELPASKELDRLWALAAGRWQNTRRFVAKRPGYLTAGPLRAPCATAEVR